LDSHRPFIYSIAYGSVVDGMAAIDAAVDRWETEAVVGKIN
jgi:hypothetical protein